MLALMASDIRNASNLAFSHDAIRRSTSIESLLETIKLSQSYVALNAIP